MESPMEIEVLLFAALKEALGDGRITVELEPGATGRDLRRHLDGRYPRWKTLFAASRLAQGVEFLDEEAPLDPREPVAVIPPVSGGAPEPGEGS